MARHERYHASRRLASRTVACASQTYDIAEIRQLNDRVRDLISDVDDVRVAAADDASVSDALDATITALENAYKRLQVAMNQARKLGRG